MKSAILKKITLFLSLLLPLCTLAQREIHWSADGNAYYEQEEGNIVQYSLPQSNKTIVVKRENLIPAGKDIPLRVKSFQFSHSKQQVLLYTNAKKVWRLDTRGDYWVYDLTTKQVKQVGITRPASSLMFAKFSPNGTQVAYVSEYNLYVEDIATGTTKAITTNGNRKLIHGTFDWAYEEEFFCRDGFRWSPDGKQIAFWQIDANGTKDYMMMNHTDSIYAKTIPVEYPVAGELPSNYKIGVANVAASTIQWMQIPNDEKWRTYLPRMEWAANSTELIVQHLNRKQNESNLLLCNTVTGASTIIYTEKDPAWIDILPSWDNDYAMGGWDWLSNGKEFLWASEKDGWRHLYRISRNGKNETLITKGNYDVMDIGTIDEKGGYVYFHASLTNATQKYLYRTKLDGTGTAELLSPAKQSGTHYYDVSPNGKFAQHRFSNHYTEPVTEWISLPNHKGLNGTDVVNDAVKKADQSKSNIEFFTVKTQEGIEMNAWMVKPANFDASKKYPVVFYVYTEPWGQTVADQYGVAYNYLYGGDMSRDGYIYISIDNRGTPVPKGREWRKVVYRKIGVVNMEVCRRKPCCSVGMERWWIGYIEFNVSVPRYL
jgi:dipeptidyl-peptidase 4